MRDEGEICRPIWSRSRGAPAKPRLPPQLPTSPSQWRGTYPLGLSMSGSHTSRAERAAEGGGARRERQTEEAEAIGRRERQTEEAEAIGWDAAPVKGRAVTAPHTANLLP